MGCEASKLDYKQQPILHNIKWDVMGNPIGDCSQTIKISLTKSDSKLYMLLTSSVIKTYKSHNGSAPQHNFMF